MWLKVCTVYSLIETILFRITYKLFLDSFYIELFGNYRENELLWMK